MYSVKKKGGNMLLTKQRKSFISAQSFGSNALVVFEDF